MDLSTSIQIVLALLTVLLIVALVFSWKNWRAHTIALVALNFIAAAVFGYLATRTLRTHAVFTKATEKARAAKEYGYLDYLERIAKTEKEIQGLRNGQEDDGKRLAGIVEVQEELGFLLKHRGRAWIKCNATTDKIGSRNITVTIPDAHGITKDSLLYVFRDTEDENKQKRPEDRDLGTYIGEFRVKSVAGAKIELELGHQPLSSDSRNLQATSVSVYEVMPVDNHDWYAADEALRTMFAKRLEADSKLKDKVLAEFERDGKEAKADDPAESIWVPVVFKAEYTAPAVPNAKGKEAELKFAIGDKAWLPKLAFGNTIKGADDLIKDGVAEADPALKPIYRRVLNDYASRFDDVRRQMVELYAIQEQTNRQIAALERDIATVTKMNAEVTDEKAKLTADVTHLTAELNAIQTYQGQVMTVLAERGKKYNELFKQNREMANQIFELQWKAVEEANKKSQATASK